MRPFYIIIGFTLLVLTVFGIVYYKNRGFLKKIPDDPNDTVKKE